MNKKTSRLGYSVYLANGKARAKKSLATYLHRRPHRSFRLTRRRDYARSLQMPGYWRFSQEVMALLWKHRRTFILLTIVYGILTAIFVGISSKEAYDQLSEVLGSSGDTVFGEGWAGLGHASLLLISALSGSFAPQLSDVQQVYSALLFVLLWLTTVWLLRSILSGKNPKLRDAIYNAGSPLISSAIVFLVLLIQFIPLALAIIIVNAGVSSGIIDGGILAMLLWIIVGLLSLLSVYWVTSTVIALIVVTLPGMYPWQAIRTAGDLVIGRRLRILLRLLWAACFVGLLWVLVVLPALLLDGYLRKIFTWFEAVPFIPIVIVAVTSLATVIMAAYIYLLYRKVVEDDSSPA